MQLLNHVVGNGLTGFMSVKVMRFMKQSTDTFVMMNILHENQSYITKLGKLSSKLLRNSVGLAQWVCGSLRIIAERVEIIVCMQV